MSRIGAAVIGTGFMGQVHTEALRRVGVPVVGILGSSPDQSKVAARTLGIETAFGDLKSLLSDERVHSVHVATPNWLHFDMVQRILNSGRHVLCEKPLALDAVESAELVRLSQQHDDLAAGVNYNVRFYPLCAEARQRVREGEFGQVLHATGSYVQDWLLYDTDYNWRVLHDKGGELRAIADIGTHWLDLVQHITGQKITSVCADLSTVHPVRHRPTGELETFQGSRSDQNSSTAVSIKTEDCGAVLFRMTDGATGCFHVSQVTAGRKNCLRFEVAGSQQSMSWNSEQPDELWIGHRDRANEILLRDPALLSANAAAITDYPGGHQQGYADSFKQCFRAFYNYIEAGDFTAASSFPTFEDGHQETLLCEAILRSHRTRQWSTVTGKE